jgi:hypothetical protein
MVVNSMTQFSNDQVNAASTLTPTTLKQITQLFESEDCLKTFQQFDQSGSVPTLAFNKQQPKARSTLVKSNANPYCGGTTTIVSPIKYEPLATIDLKAENASSSEEESEGFNEDDDDDEYQPAAKKRMQTRNGGVRKATFSSGGKAKEPATEKKRKGKGNMKDDYHGLPPSERQRLMQRRERNKMAAARCRQRREDLTKSLQADVKAWQGKNIALEEELRLLRTQKEELEFMLQAHSKTCRLGLTAPSILAVKSVPSVIVEPVKAVYTVQEKKRSRPVSLTLSLSSDVYPGQMSGPEGVLIETPSTVIPSFDSFLTSTGLTPIVTSIATPIFSIISATPTSCSYQQRSHEVPDLNTPSETVSLVSL